eukprot:IDg11419t1
MPKREDFIRTGRHDLRYAMHLHGGCGNVAKRIGLVFCDIGGDWIGHWLALQAGKLGCVLMANELPGNPNSSVIQKISHALDGHVLGINEEQNVWMSPCLAEDRSRLNQRSAARGKGNCTEKF